ncbi:piggyBac transposable element-derived protein 4-like [Battus philenor]|uniref:piggyBac transposable element-derived protein 4-like n=1 Tax=Battus philenor TaxID=42288 RepID=UPI0035D02993
MDLLKHVQDAKVQNAKNGLASEKVKTDDMENEKIMEKEYTGADQFKWKPLNGWHGVKNPFLKEYSGPTAAFTNSYDTFRAYWDDNALSHIAAQTNAYSSQFRDKFYKDWINTNADEIMILFAFWIMLGILKMPTIKACYSEVNVIRTDIFRRLMTENRYVNLNKFYYVNQLNGKDSDSFLINFETLIDYLNLKFKELYNLEQEVSVDESSNLWKFENCDDKTLSSRIKIPLLCESSSTYIWSFLVDINREQNARKPRPDEYVRKLMQPILNCGHTLYTDSCYTCPMLARYFKQNKTNFVGKVISTKNVPLIIRNAVLNEGEFVARQSGDVMLVAFQGEKREYYLSTCHGAVQIHDSGSGESGQYKLLVINEYNRGIKQIGQIDYCTEPYLQGKDVKWEIKLFKTLLNMSIHNSQILLEKSMNLKVSSLAFRLSLVQAIIDKHLNKVPKQKSTIEFPMERLTERHFIRRISIARNDIGQNIINSQMCIRKTCVWCSRKGRDRKTAFECPNCNVALCIDCFELFHTTFG